MKDERTVQYSPLFSFFDNYQDFVNDLGYFMDASDQGEVDLLRKNLVIDTHVKFNNQSNQISLLGYDMTPCDNLEDDYSPDFIINHAHRNPKEGVDDSHPLNVGKHILIDDQLKWLMKELDIS